MTLYEIEEDTWVFKDSSITFELYEEYYDIAESWSYDNSKAIEKRLLNLIEKCPNHIDAIHHLSLIYGEMGKGVEANIFCRAAVAIGLDAIPSKFSWESSRLEWGSTDNRPFMRAYQSLGLWYQDHSDHENAIKVFERLLSVNPNDNQGCRYLLPISWFAIGKASKIIMHCNKYSDDIAPEIIYSIPLALILINKPEEAKQKLEYAVSQLPLVGKELLKKKHPRPKNQSPGYITQGGHDQAYEYCKHFGKFWNDESIKMLTEVVNLG